MKIQFLYYKKSYYNILMKSMKKKKMVICGNIISRINFSAKRFKLFRQKYYLDTHK